MKHKDNPAYKDMLKAGHTKKEIDDLLELAKVAFKGFVPVEIHPWLIARHLGVRTSPLPRSHYMPSLNTYKVSEVNNVTDGTYINIKGLIVKVYDDGDHISVFITDMKVVLRCILFGASVEKFKEKKFRLGDKIKFKSIEVKSYKGQKELKGNEYTYVLKLKNNKNIRV